MVKRIRATRKRAEPTPQYFLNGKWHNCAVVDTPRPTVVNTYHRNKNYEVVGFLYPGKKGYRYFCRQRGGYYKEPDASVVDAAYQVRQYRKKFTFSAGVCRSGT